MLLLSFTHSVFCLVSKQIIRQPQPWGAVKDEVVTFTVFAKGDGKLTFKWHLNDKLIEQSDEIQQEDDENSSTISLKFSPRKHSGTYQCLVSDKTRSGPLSSNKVVLKGKGIVLILKNVRLGLAILSLHKSVPKINPYLVSPALDMTVDTGC